MKKVVLSLIIMFLVAAILPAMAQKGAMKLGPQIGYGFDAKTLGVGAKFTYGLSDQIRLNPGFMYFLPKSEETIYVDPITGQTETSSWKTTWWELNLDGNYMFGDEDELCFYGLAGLNITGVSVSYEATGELDFDLSESTTEVGINLGGGVQYPFTDKMSGFAELKYTAASTDQLGFAAGLLFSL
jgi:outer membrane protein X